MKAITTTLVAASVLMAGFAGLSTEAAAKRKYAYAFVPYAYGPYVVSAPWFAYSTYGGGFSPIPIAMGTARMLVAPLDLFPPDMAFMDTALTQIAPPGMAHFLAPTRGGVS